MMRGILEQCIMGVQPIEPLAWLEGAVALPPTGLRVASEDPTAAADETTWAGAGVTRYTSAGGPHARAEYPLDADPALAVECAWVGVAKAIGWIPATAGTRKTMASPKPIPVRRDGERNLLRIGLADLERLARMVWPCSVLAIRTVVY